MSYIPHTDADVRKMSEAVGVSFEEAAYAAIPEELRLNRELELPEALSESDLLDYFRKLSEANRRFEGGSFLGAGAYRHFIPSIVETVISRSEFLTAYTPYQAEASQGTLQTIFEFQSLICRLTGMDVANASVYDGGTAAVDAVLMAVGQTGKKKVLVSMGVHPQIREVMETYLAGSDIKLEYAPLSAQTGRTELPEIASDTAAVLVQNPNFMGIIEDGPELCRKAHEGGALAAVAVNDPVNLALLKAPGAYGADICCGDAQPFGNPVAYGGPYVGFLACTQKLMRRIPGRLVGMTEDHDGKRGFCLTLQAREQHIRREKASSNICSNEALCALAATVYLCAVGPEGLRRSAEAGMRNAAYFRSRIAEAEGLELVFAGPHMNEFAARFPKGVAEEFNRFLAERSIQGGYVLDGVYSGLEDCMLLCCTELCKKAQIDAWAEAWQAFKERQ
ncbi:aminomethyl-transferring glycine dehydrogenase subunit GcvPA [bacterium]|nr:aminomethyl-transferring glycine dehydrogenase subunit GcvPA [bacterium]